MKISNKIKVYAGLAIVAMIVLFATFNGAVGKNDNQYYQVKQSLSGTMSIIDKGGWYSKMFATTTQYPKSFQADFGESGVDGTSNRITFYDGGLGWITATYKVRMPVSAEQRLLIHREFTGSVKNVERSIEAHLIACLKATAPLMSATEHQAARKAEFNSIVEQQFKAGLFGMKKVADNQTVSDEEGKDKVITIYRTEITRDENGHNVIAQISPLEQYGLEVTQFSITATDYDTKTREQFGKKKEASLAAELAKMEVDKERQERLKVVERGLREKAEAEAKANVQLETETINAEREKQVAVTTANKEKEVAELAAEKLVQVALLTKEEAETRAEQNLAVAKLEREAAAEEAEGRKLLADAKKYEIEQADGLSEAEKYEIEMRVKESVGVAAELSKVHVPSLVISGSGSGGSGGSSTQEQLMNMYLLEKMGVINKSDAPIVLDAVK